MEICNLMSQGCILFTCFFALVDSEDIRLQNISFQANFRIFSENSPQICDFQLKSRKGSTCLN